MASLASHSVLTDEEELLVSNTEKWLRENNKQEISLVIERFQRLKNLGNAVFDYPSIKETKFVRDILVNENQLTESLLAFSAPSHMLRIPAKVAALRSFLIAKFHAFTLLSNLTAENEELQTSSKDVAFSVIFTLMAEDVYFSCLEDPTFSNNTKSRLAHDLIALWDSGTDVRSIRHLMALSSLWTARDAAPPSFGTMDGNTELLRISIDMSSETEWEEFLKEESTNDKTRWALEEFLFGLSYEEIQQIRGRLKKYGVTCVSHDELRSYLDARPVYSIVNDHDPRAIYDFFIERRDACTLRKRVHAPGPFNTLEEIYLKYRIVLEST
ncbi:MAG: hypothetical protein FWC19_01660 [Treponema sp.]|nr:hypothetical protein [Treponema sp.]MCL2271498.1 hypothetical protein [Treponema sp.]